MERSQNLTTRAPPRAPPAHGSGAVSRENQIVYSQIGRGCGIYSLGRRLGSGSFGDTYFAVNT